MVQRLRPLQSRRLLGDLEIDLALEDIDACDENAQLIADRKTAARLAPGESPLARIENVEVIGERRDMDETAQEYIRQLDEQSIIPNIDDRGAKNLRIARVELALEELELLHLHRIDLGLGGDAFGDRDMLRGCGDPAHICPGAPVPLLSSQRTIYKNDFNEALPLIE